MKYNQCGLFVVLGVDAVSVCAVITGRDVVSVVSVASGTDSVVKSIGSADTGTHSIGVV